LLSRNGSATNLYIILADKTKLQDGVSLFSDEKLAETFEDLEKIAYGRSHSVASSRQEDELKNSVTGLRRAR